MIKVSEDLFVDGNGGFVYCSRLRNEDNYAEGDFVYCGVHGWHDSADKFCPEPKRLTEKELRRLYLHLPVGRHYYTVAA